MTQANSFDFCYPGHQQLRKYRARALSMTYFIFIPYSAHFLIIIKILDDQSLFIISREAAFKNNLVGQSYLVYTKTVDSAFRAL